MVRPLKIKWITILILVLSLILLTLSTASQDSLILNEE